MIENGLPKGWALIELSEITDYKKGKKPKKMQSSNFEGALVYLDIRAIEKGNDEIFVDKESSNHTNENDLIVVWDGARAGWVAKSRKGAIGSTIMALTPKIGKDYLFRYLQTQLNYIQSNHRGTGIPHVDPDIFWNLKVPIAPTNEQGRIVSKLEAIFAKIETNQRRLEKIPKLLKRFRQSILAAAVSGKLSEEWRNINDNIESGAVLLNKIQKYRKEWADKETKKGNNEAKRIITKLNKHSFEPLSYSIPETWEYSSLLNACHLVVDCHNKTAPYVDQGIYLVRTTNVKQGRIVLDDIRYVTDATYKYWSKRSIPLEGDIIFTREAPMGEAAIIPSGMKVCLGQRTMLLKMPGDYLNNKYILYCLMAPKMVDQINEKAIGSGVKHLRVGDVESLTIPVPPIEEQNEIVRRVEQLFAFADRIESRYIKSKKMVDKLPQSISTKAFRGELVAQDPNDEPAEELLKRIQEEKEKKRFSKLSEKKVKVKDQKENIKPEKKKKAAKKKILVA